MMPATAVVTGGATGIGRATVDALLGRGYRVVVIGRGSGFDELEENHASAVADGHLFVESVDVSDAEQVGALAESVRDRFGGCRVLVNAAGAFVGGPLHEARVEDIRLMFDVNLNGVVNTCRAFLPLMLDTGGGSIVNVASLSGIRADYNAPLYCASKAAVISLTQALALDYGASNIRVHAGSPSATNTRMFLDGSEPEVIASFEESLPDNRIGDAVDVARAIMFLADPSSIHINGQNLAVDGGLSAWNGQPRQDKTEG